LFEELAGSDLMRSHSFQAVSGGWCAPLGNGFRIPGLGVSDCKETTREALRQIADSPSVNTVVLVAEWANYTQGFRNNGFGTMLKPALCEDQEGKSSSVADNKKIVLRALQATIDLLAKRGKRVLIVGPTPEFKVRVMDYVVKKAFFSRSANLRAFAPQISIQEYEQRTAEITEVFEQLRGAELLETRGLFCGPQLCDSVDADGSILFSDTNHVTNYGARLIVHEIERAVGAADAATPDRP
jgi:hypothetical protein